MKRLGTLFLCATLVQSMVAATTTAEFDQTLDKAALEQIERIKTAGNELNATRGRIDAERAPLLAQLRATEDRILSLEVQISRLENAAAHGEENRRRLIKEGDTARKNLSYFSSLAQDGLRGLQESVAGGEVGTFGQSLQDLQAKLESATASNDVAVLAAVPELYLLRIKSHLGGFQLKGAAVVSDTNRVVEGRFAYVGPEVLFRSNDGAIAGSVRVHEGSSQPIVHPLSSWSSANAAAFFSGKLAAVPLDPSGGKSLKLEATKGSVLQHIHRGGVVAYAIIAVGVVALLLIGQKTYDLFTMKDNPVGAVDAVMKALSSGDTLKARQATERLQGAMKEVFSEGLHLIGKSKDEMEEALAALLLQKRLHYERRLPLLAVIATASPLMGLLGTVIGMVRTFALITVFGTGNAAKLSSGISEVLITTELGLLVAIPALVAHGFLSQRIQRNLAQLEGKTIDFVNAADRGLPAPKAQPAPEAYPQLVNL